MPEEKILVIERCSADQLPRTFHAEEGALERSTRHPALITPWAEPSGRVLEALSTKVDAGLSTREAQRRLRQYGHNQLRQTRPRSGWRILWDQFASLIVALLVVAAGVAFAFDERVEAFAIVGVIFINAAIGFFTERRALRAMEALRELGHSETLVRRSGSVLAVPAYMLVPGDLVILDAGDVLTADVRLVSGSRLQIDESPLTGESFPVDKNIEPVAPTATLAERSSVLFKGTAVTRGSGEAVVVATGMATELGQISSLVDESEPESTPLEKRLDRLGRRLIGLTLGIAALVAGMVVASGRDAFFAVEIAIALAVATIPEGLPIVATVALARGMWRMARRNALVEQLSAVETLGSTTVILTDKTGTLTENQMTVVELRLAEGRVQVSGTGLETSGSFNVDGQKLSVSERPEVLEALRTAVLCNNATLEHPAEGDIRVTGDPTEVALLVLGAKAGLARESLVLEWPELREIAFDPETKRMATLHDHEGAIVAATKGAPETLIECCTSIRTKNGSEALNQHDRESWLTRANEMAATGERVLALATAQVKSATSFDFEDLMFLGLVGFFDPPRERVPAAISACQNAGIRVVMVTGDHGATAWNVAAAVGLVDAQEGEPSSFVDGRALPPLQDLTETETAKLLESSVIARATPRQKLDLIDLHQRSGAVVAMTGDGVNDAPALKKADIGVAMGVRGTQVAREAADMVLGDDELGTIVVAVAEGRAIFSNIRKFVVYLMSCNVSEILAVGLGVLVQGPLPILPLQILFLNLVTDVFPALALGVGEGSPALMDDPPRDPQEPALSRQHWQAIFSLGAVMAISVRGALGIAVVALGYQGRQATTVAFVTLAMAQLWHVFTMRNPGSGWIQNEVTRNPWIWSALGLCLALLLAAVYWPALADLLSIVDPGLSGWAVAILFSLVPLVVGQLSLAPCFRGGSVRAVGQAARERTPSGK
jgi:Ca2+-transporting ATPase